MSRLRIYRQNQGDMLELVRFQKKEMKQAAGAEEVIYTATDMIRMENANRKRLGVMADMPIYSIPISTDKKDSCVKKSHLGVVKEDKKNIMVEKSLILKTDLRDTLSIKFLQ